MKAEREKEVPPPSARAQALDKTQDKTDKQDSGRTVDSFVPEQRLNGRMLTRRYSRGRQNDEVSTGGFEICGCTGKKTVSH